ncbi:MAG: SOS response-associated peptidase [Chloroflexi bacterium]|nr:SOS response-associated peptidase [Chloroflexota bacterium]MCI0581149.1 SOS response-associated peptidase [Chloroflexota bacterium]MCI0645381.1 SOS response-associated peptidase [Chloroflexota bacterium]MCI0727188.1 SOS response-associated peptidase [Chloroflexota bacterium]
MCGRFTLTATGEEVAEAFQLPETGASKEALALAPRYNIAPTQPVAAVRVSEASGNRELAYFHWGLIPSWSQDPAIGSRMINARAETAAEKPSFRAALRYRRCLVPADGFYEWQKQNGGKQPVYIHLQDGRPFGIAGLWEYWQGPDGSEIESCTLLTVEPNELLSAVHNRMPLILAPEDYELWLDPKMQKPADLQHLLRPYPAAEMTFYRVSTLVNNPRNEDPACIVPLS